MKQHLCTSGVKSYELKLAEPGTKRKQKVASDLSLADTARDFRLRSIFLITSHRFISEYCVCYLTLEMVLPKIISSES
jgi:hypothetical protein